MTTHNRKGVYFYYFILMVFAVFILFSDPFMRYPYDVYEHMIAIDEKYHNLSGTITSIQPGRLIWHTIWAKVFQTFHIESIDFFFRAKIIHVVQSYIALFSIFYFSLVVLRNLFIDIPTLTLKYLSLWSVFIWFTIYATFSMHYHMIWNLWYSVSYQITLPLFFYIMALTLVIFLEKISLGKRIFFLFQILILVLFILRAHPMELIYYGMYILVLSIVYKKKSAHLIKQHIYVLFLLISALVYFSISFDLEEVKLFTYFTPNNIGLLYSDLVDIGRDVVNNYNRSDNVINELMYLIMYGTVLMLFFIWKNYKDKLYIDIRMITFIVLTSMFICIPQYIFSAGFFSLLTKPYVVHRLYYSSSLFILLPIIIYYFSKYYKIRLFYMNLVTVLLIVIAVIYSKYSSSTGHNYYKNIQSIYDSFGSKYAFHFSKKDMEYLSERISEYEHTRIHKNRDNLYFARGDIAFVLKYIYGRKAYWTGRRNRVNYQAAFLKNSIYTRYNCILFKTKEDFPENPYFK